MDPDVSDGQDAPTSNARPVPTLGLAAAREKATDALRDAAKGQDPGRQKIEERRAETFSDLAREYIERHAGKKRSGREDVRLVNGSPHKGA